MNHKRTSEDPDNIVGSMLTTQVELDLWWGLSRLGLILSSAYFNQKPLTTAEIADLMGISHETVRKHLRPLISIDRVRVIEEGRSVRYLAQQIWALKTRHILKKAQQATTTDWVVPKRLVPFELSNDNVDNELGGYNWAPGPT